MADTSSVRPTGLIWDLEVTIGGHAFRISTVALQLNAQGAYPLLLGRAWRKDGDEVYILDKESIDAIKEELSDDFLSLADEQMTMVGRLVAQLDDDQLDNQLRFKRYEWERRQQEAAKKTTMINIDDEEQSSEQKSDKAGTGESQPDLTQEEQPREEHLQQPLAPTAGKQQSEEQHLEEPETVQQQEQQEQPTEQQQEE